MIVNTI